MKRPSRSTIGYILLGAIALFVASQLMGSDEKTEELTLTEFFDAVDDGDGGQRHHQGQVERGHR